MENLKHIIESLLFVAEEPLTVDKIKRITAQAESKEINDTLAALSAEYEARQGGFYLDEVAGGYQIRTRPEYNEWIRKLIQPRPLRLSKAALETLVIIAYKQPIIRNDVEHLRGVDCGGVLRVLLERKLVRVLGRREIAGRPLIYATTKHFLEVFDLKNLRDLPTPKEIEELGASLTESEEADTLKSIDENEENLDSPNGPETELESSSDHEAAPDTPENQEPAEASSENDSAADNPPDGEDGHFAPAEETPIIHVSPAPPAETEAAGAPLPLADGGTSPENLLKTPENFLKK
jgi:segregation and condensation protein B